MAIGKQAPCSDRYALHKRYYMPCCGVQSIVLQIDRYGLFLDEYCFANGAQDVTVRVPACRSNDNVGWCFHRASHQTLFPCLHRSTTADLNHGAVNIAGLVRSEKGIGIGNLFRFCQATKWHTVNHRLHYFRRDGLQYGRLYETRTNGVGTNALSSQLPCPGFCHSNDAELACRIICLSEIAVDTHHRRGIEDHPGILRDHDIDNRPSAVISALEIDIDDALE